MTTLTCRICGHDAIVVKQSREFSATDPRGAVTGEMPLCPVHATTPMVGERITGRDVTLGCDRTGIVSEMIVVTPSDVRFRLTDTGERYGNGKPIEPIVVAS